MDQTLLDQILADSKEFNGYDVIIDDGGHTANQMLTSIKVTHPAILMHTYHAFLLQITCSHLCRWLTSLCVKVPEHTHRC